MKDEYESDHKEYDYNVVDGRRFIFAVVFFIEKDHVAIKEPASSDEGA